ncbi:hypothetical protein ACHAXA_004875 [Cyclostephanos tholiformis]|uniref:Holocytochrome c-type synthase n=1 Tax=Cyclostephanos tholiformis TaxID=382380 RepID=A0ABD3RRW3_9STRA
MASNVNDTITPPQPTSTSATSGCPVLSRDVDAEPSIAKPGIWSRWFHPTTTTTTTTTKLACPARGIEYADQPASIEEAAGHSQLPSPGQRVLLSTQRVVSSIPRGEVHDGDSSTASVPTHQPARSDRWQYPSEQQFYNAMLRKGYRPPVDAIPSVLRIHNAVNERSWQQVRRWEGELHGNREPRLVKFVGRPKDLSPRAWWNSRVLMTEEPFDRHDWYVMDANGSGETRRYVIDFYEGAGGRSGDSEDSASTMIAGPPSMYIDVRPALDNPSAAVDRMTMFAREALPGLTAMWDSYRGSPSHTPSSGGIRVDSMDGSKGEDGIQKS